MRRISKDIRREAFQLWMKGYAYRDISERLNIGLGSIARIVEEKRREAPDIDALRRLQLQLEKTRFYLPDALRGLACLEELNRLGISLNEVESYKAVVKRASEGRQVEPENFVDGAVMLMKLEAETGKTYMEVVADFSDKRQEVEKLEGITNNLKAEVDGLNRELERLKEQRTKTEMDRASIVAALERPMKTQERLERLGLEKVGRLAEFVESYEALGYDTEEVKELAGLKKALLRIRVNPADLKQFIGKKSQMDDRIEKLTERLRLLETNVKALERRRRSLINENESLLIVSEVLRSRTTKIACSYCGGTLEVPLPSRWELEGSMKMMLIYPVRCYHCGYINQITPQDLLASIGWIILK